VSDELPIGTDERALDDAALEALAESVAAAPPPGLRGVVLSAVAHEAGFARRLGRWRRMAFAASAAAAALVALLAWDARQSGRRSEEQAGALAALEASRRELAARLEAQQREILVLSESLATQSELMRILATPRLLTASLAPQTGRTGSARVVVDPDSGEAALVISELPPIASEQVYELWAIRGEGAPEPAGLFVGEGASRTVRLPDVADPTQVTAFAVSIEPAGGSPQPTGPIVLIGTVGT
jgi:anti-sigma-K factor RskA